jgi:hypothetical protein
MFSISRDYLLTDNLELLNLSFYVIILCTVFKICCNLHFIEATVLSHVLVKSAFAGSLSRKERGLCFCNSY